MTSIAAWKDTRLPLLIAIALGFAVHATRTAPTPVAATPMPVAVPPTPMPISSPSPPPPSPATPAAAPQRGNIPGLSVNATFAGRTGGGSIFVTRPDGSRALVATGGDVVPGVRLVAVAADRATFATGATQFWLPLRAADAATADPMPATPIVTGPTPPSPATAETQRRESQAYQAALAPGIDGPYRGYAVRAQTPLFAKAGLKPGDIITGINGRAFDGPAAIAGLSREASLSETVVFTIRRDGRSQELRADPE